MLLKITAIAILAVIANSEGKKVWDGFTAKWSLNHTDGFFSMPQDSWTAKTQGWTKISGVGAPDGVLTLGYFNDPRVVLLFCNRTRKVIGIQIGVPCSDIERGGVPINYNNNPAITKKTLNGCDYFTATALFKQDEEKDTRQLWFEINGGFVEIPTKSDLVISETPYYLKKCFIWMGLHYYQINSTTDCYNYFPLLLLRVKEDVIGFGMQIIGTPSAAPERTWFETRIPGTVKLVIPDALPCFEELTGKYGLISLHIYFKKHPLSIVCTDECTAAYSTDDTNESYRTEHRRSKRATGPGNVCDPAVTT